MTEAVVSLPPAEPDRRFYAFVVDRLVVWTVDAAAAYLAYRYLVDRDHPVAGALVVVGALLLVGAALAVVLGLTGSSPGRAAAGIRVLGTGDGAPIGAGAALRRQLVLGLATLPTFGLGAAVLAWTALADPSGRRHGWHDRVAGSEAVDVRAPRVEPAAVEVAPRHLVNLTALRLVPAPAPPSPIAPSAAPGSRRQQSGRPRAHQPAAPPDSAPLARWRVRFDSGESLVVAGPALVGRHPAARPGEPVRHLVALCSTDLSLSKTHAQLHLDADGVLVVTDRGSANGSTLLRGGATRELPAGRPTTLLDGDVVRFGDREMRVVREDRAGLDRCVTVR